MNKLQASLAIGVYVFALNAQAALFDDKEARKKILAVEAQASTDHEQQAAEIEDLNKRATAQSQSMLDMQNELELLRQEVAELRGALEVANHTLATGERRQKDLYADTDKRIRKLEGEAGVVDQVGLLPSSSPEAGNVDAYKAYKEAYGLSQEAKHNEAFEAYDAFIKAYPDSKYMPDAIYGLGYSQFALKNYKSSIASQQKLLAIYPNSAKAPNAMYSIANSQIQLGQIDNAKKVLRNLIAKYANATVTPSAQKRLKVLESIK